MEEKKHIISNKATLKQVDEDYFLCKDGKLVDCPIRTPIKIFNQVLRQLEEQRSPCNYMCALSSLQTDKDGNLFYIQRCGAGNAIPIQSVQTQSDELKNKSAIIKSIS